MDLATGTVVEEGMAVGIIAAQSIGELSMRLSHVQDRTRGLSRVTELFEARRPRDPAVMAEVAGIVNLGEKCRGKLIIEIQPIDDDGQRVGEPIEHQVPPGKHLRVNSGDRVKE